MPRPGSRKWFMDLLKVGESHVFIGVPGQLASNLQASIASCYRGEESMSQQGLTQDSGIAVFPLELSRPLVRVTRISEPKPTSKNSEK